MDNSDSYIQEARQLVAQSLRVAQDVVNSDTSLYAIPAWDSLGQLRVVLGLEKHTGIKVNDATTFESLTSVRKIAQYLASHK